jgi:hypothetical protein
MSSRRSVHIVLVLVFLFSLLTNSSFAHPASGIVVDDQGHVYFIYSRHEVMRIELALAVGGVPKTDRRYVSVSVPQATSLFVAACFQYPTVKRCRRWVGRSSSSIIATA